jgi:hypothetical protein
LKGPILRQSVLIGGITTATFGVYGLFIHKQYANSATALLAVVGFVMTFVGLYITLRASGTDRSHHRTGPSPWTADSKPERRVQTLASLGDKNIPLTYGLAFLASAVFSFIGTLISLNVDIRSSGTIQFIQNYENNVNKFAIFIVCACILQIVGLPGFYAFQSARAHYSSLFGCIALALSSFFGSMALWALASGGPAYQPVYPGFFQVNPTYRGLDLIANWLGIIASPLIAIAIIRARVFPTWTAAVMLIGIIVSFIWIAGGDTSPASDVIQRLGALTGAVTTARFALVMMKRQPLGDFGTFRERL